MTFDPYHKWLGIAPKDQPPNYYRLLAIDLFESDPEVIDAAANRQMAYLQQRATGQHAALSQKLLNEIAAARLCLLNPQSKVKYDAQFQVPAQQTHPIAPPILPDIDAGVGGAAEPSPSDLRTEFVPPGKGEPLLRPASRTIGFAIEPWPWVAATAILATLSFGVWILFMRGEDMYVSGGASPLQVQVADLEAKIAEWQVSRDKLNSMLKRLGQDKAAVLQKLDQLGIRSDSDLGKDARAEVFAQELKDILRDTATCEKKLQDYDLAITKSEAHVRRFARQLAAESAGVSNAELEELSRSMITMDESLVEERKVSLPVDFDTVLQKEVAPRRQEDGVTEGNASKPSKQSGGSSTQSKLTKPDAPKIFDVKIFPSWAKLEVSSGNGTIFGEGTTRQVRITSGSGFRLVASAPDFTPCSEWHTASAGDRRTITIALQRAASNSPTVRTANVENGATNPRTNNAWPQQERNKSSTTKTVPSSKPRQNEADDWLRWSGNSVTVFDGKTLKSWSVCDKRSIESVVTLNHQNRSMVFKENAAIYPRIVDSGEPPTNFMITANILLPQTSWAYFYVRRDQNVEIRNGSVGQIHADNGRMMQAVRGAHQAVAGDGKQTSNMIPPIVPAALFPATWNTLQITCNGTRWTVKINGRLVNQADGDSADPYHFCLLADTGFEVRDIRVRKLD